jgi:hypothetical protein
MSALLGSRPDEPAAAECGPCLVLAWSGVVLSVHCRKASLREALTMAHAQTRQVLQRRGEPPVKILMWTFIDAHARTIS